MDVQLLLLDVQLVCAIVRIKLNQSSRDEAWTQLGLSLDIKKYLYIITDVQNE